jgi:proline iminopeptidase
MFITVNGARPFFDVAGSHLDLTGEKEREKPVLLILHGGPGADHVNMRSFFYRFACTV